MSVGMQRTVGNARVSRMMGEGSTLPISPPTSVGVATPVNFADGAKPLLTTQSTSVRAGLGTTVQAQLAVNAPGDVYEQEADRVAETVTHGTKEPHGAGRSSRLSAGGAAARINREAIGQAETQSVTEGFDEHLQARIQSPGAGRPLPPRVRQEMESGLGADLSNVRIHDSATDQADADRLNAKAFTHGHDIWIGSTGSAHDRKLMAHELTHVVQQTGNLRRKPANDSAEQAEAVTEPSNPATRPLSIRHGQPQSSVVGEEHLRSFHSQHAPGEMFKTAELPVRQPPELGVTASGLEPLTEAPGELGPTTFHPSNAGSLHPSQIEAAAPEKPFGEGPAMEAKSKGSIVTPVATPAAPPPPDVAPLPQAAPTSKLIQRSPDDDDGGILASIRRRINSIVDGLRSGWDQLSGMAQSAFNAIHDQVTGIIGGLTSMVSSALNVIQGAWSALSQRVTQITNGIEHQVQSALTTVSSATQEIGRAILRLDANAVRAAWGRLTGLVSGVNQTLQQGVQAAYQSIAGLWQGLRSRFDTFLNDLSSRAQQLFSRLQTAVDGLRQRVLSAWNSLRDRASQMSGVLGGILERLRSLVSRLLAWGQEIWDGIQQRWNALTSRIGSFLQAAGARLSAAVEQLRSQAATLWDRIGGLWSRLQQWVKAQVNRLIAGLGSFWNRIRSFSIGSLIDKIGKIGHVVRLIEQAVQNPDAVMKPFVDGIANKLQAGMPAKAIETGTQKLNESAGSRRGPAAAQSTATVVVQRQPATATPTTTPAGVAPVRTTTTLREIREGFVAAVKYKWSKVHVWQMVKDMLRSLIWPWPAIGDQLSELWNTDLKGAVHSLFLPRNPFADFWGFLHDLWTDLLHILDIPLAVLNRLNNILMLLMGWITLALMIIGFIGGSFAGTVLGAILGALAGLGIGAGPGAAAGLGVGTAAGVGVGFGTALLIGEALFIAFLALQAAIVTNAFAKLWTGLQKPEEKDQDYDRLANSLIGLGVALVLLLIGWIASKLASLILDFLAKIPALRDPVAAFRTGLRSVRGTAGTIDESKARFTPKERLIAEVLQGEGKNVEAVPRSDVRTPDALVDGKRTEFKTMDPGADSATVRNEVNSSIKRGGQARDIIIDARGSGLKEAEAQRGLSRVGGIARGKLDSVRIIGDGYDITRNY
jgi:phage-related protein